jgi:hypothetical protein
MDFIAKALVPIVILVVLALARRYMPASSLRNRTHHCTREELDARFSSTQWIVGASVVFVGVILALGMHAALVSLNHLFGATDSAQMWLWPQSAIWWFFPGFAALILSWEIVLRIWALLGNPKDPHDYAYWTSLKAGFDSTRALRWMAVLFLLPIGALTFLELPVHVAFDQDEIRDCGYAFGACKHYRYADARRMTVVDGFRDRDSKLISRAGMVIDFSDGRRWSSANTGDFKAQADPSAKAFLESRTHLQCGHAQTEEEIPPLASSTGEPH